MEECKHLLHPLQLKLQKNALRVEISTPASRCELIPKKDQFGREYNVARYVFSGGDPIDCAGMCVGKMSHRCPLPKKVKMLKTLDPICVPNGTIGELIDARGKGLSMAKFGEYVVFVYPDEIEQVPVGF